MLRDTAATVLGNDIISENILMTSDSFPNNNTLTLTLNYTVYYVSIGDQVTFYKNLKTRLIQSVKTTSKSNNFVSIMYSTSNSVPNAPSSLVQALDPNDGFKCVSIKVSHWSDLFVVIANAPTPEPTTEPTPSPTFTSATFKASSPAPSTLLSNAYFTASQEVKGISEARFKGNFQINSVFRLSVAQSMPNDNIRPTNIVITSVTDGDRNSLYPKSSSSLQSSSSLDNAGDGIDIQATLLNNAEVSSPHNNRQLQQRPLSIMVNYTVHYYTPAPHAVYKLLANDLTNRVFGKFGIYPTFNDILASNAALYPNVQPILTGVTSNFVRISQPYFTNNAFDPTARPTSPPKPWVMENYTLVIAVSVSVVLVVMCLSIAGAYFYLQRLQKKGAYLKWSETYDSRSQAARHFMGQRPTMGGGTTPYNAEAGGGDRS